MLPIKHMAHGRLSPFFLPTADPHLLNDDLLRAMIEADPKPAARSAHADLIAVPPMRGLIAQFAEILGVLTGLQRTGSSAREI